MILIQVAWWEKTFWLRQKSTPLPIAQTSAILSKVNFQTLNILDTVDFAISENVCLKGARHRLGDNPPTPALLWPPARRSILSTLIVTFLIYVFLIADCYLPNSYLSPGRP